MKRIIMVAVTMTMIMVAMVHAHNIMVPSKKKILTDNYVFDLTAPTSKFPHYWETCVGSGHATLALRADYQRLLTQAHNELGFQYVRFHGLFTDDMSTYTIINTVPMYSFFNMDTIYDFLLSINVRPIVELSFMPKLLASGNTTVFHWDANVTPPKSYDDWGTLVRTTVQHLVDRYGLVEVQKWYFECWNEPNLGVFWTGTQQQYFDLYAVTAAAVKAVSPTLRVGGPATAGTGWLPEFTKFVQSRNLPIDFMSTHEYPTDLDPQPFDRHMMYKVWRKARAQVPSNLPLFYTEFNDGLYASPPYHDTPFAAAFAAKAASDGQGVVDIASWWTFSDTFEEQGFSPIPFNDPNGWGLMNRHGIPKPSYRAYQLLHNAGDQRVSLISEEFSAASPLGAYALTSAGSRAVQFFLYSYDDPNVPCADAIANVTVQGMPSGVTPLVEITLINSGNGNAVTAWKAMGSPSYLSQQQVSSLKDASQLVSRPLSWTRVGPTTIQFMPTIEGNSLAMVSLRW